jgi:hypothetical protein
VMNSSRMCWHGTMCSFTIKFSSLIVEIGSLLATLVWMGRTMLK